MKRSLKMLISALALVMMFSVAAYSVFAAFELPMVPSEPDVESGNTSVYGDVDADGKLTRADAEIYLMHIYFPAEYDAPNHDFNKDGVFNDADVSYLMKHIENPSEFPLN